jgi:hypothetical protein
MIAETPAARKAAAVMRYTFLLEGVSHGRSLSNVLNV